MKKLLFLIFLYSGLSNAMGLDGINMSKLSEWLANTWNGISHSKEKELLNRLDPPEERREFDPLLQYAMEHEQKQKKKVPQSWWYYIACCGSCLPDQS